jgi:hypothetical protein
MGIETRLNGAVDAAKAATYTDPRTYEVGILSGS